MFGESRTRAALQFSREQLRLDGRLKATEYRHAMKQQGLILVVARVAMVVLTVVSLHAAW
jgi:hypothetical protein